MNYLSFFSNLGFSFNVDLKAEAIFVGKNVILNDKLKNSVFFYKSPNNTNTSFYLITVGLENQEFEEVRRYIWNKNNADLIFYFPDATSELAIYYAKYAPTFTNEESWIDTFSTTEKDLDKIDNIKKWQFDSNAFWLNYQDFLRRANFKSIDKELVITLEALKKKLDSELINSIQEENTRTEIVQALIDRTLYIKFLEDNHIINSHFYKHYFKDNTLNYKRLLERNSAETLNTLFKKIHEIFNNSLFERPTIDEKYLTTGIMRLIAWSFNTNLDTGQLKLFHFEFDILPVEFISYIYEVFLSEKQKKNGIYYTPKKLAQLIVDEVINEDRIGPVLDPSSGSGMFLIVAYQRLLEIARKQGSEPEDSLEKIRFRTQLLSENIFGIEKQLTAQRFTLFSLSLQIFKGINPEDIESFIANELMQNKKINLFSEFSFFENILHANTLDIEQKPFADKTFLYLVGNPPFFEIPNTEDFEKEISFLKSFNVTLDKENDVTAKDIVGKSQISQCFFLKIKDWADDKTRFGFVSNSSNFYNDLSEKFQDYFYSNYGIEKIYELSRVKKILFEKAKESVVALIFTNKYKSNTIDYYPVELGLFSEKPFELLIIQEDKIIPIKQNKLINKELRLRDFLFGNEYDLQFINELNNLKKKFETQIKIVAGAKSKINNGLQIVGKEQIMSEFGFSETEYAKLTKNQRKEYSLKFKEKYTSKFSDEIYPFPLIEVKDLFKFRYKSPRIYIGDISNFQRIRKANIYSLPKILIGRTGKELNAVVSLDTLYYNFDVYSIFLEENDDLYFYTALLNSLLLNYYVDFNFRKRTNSSFSKIGHDAILNLPLPNELDKDLAHQISSLSQKIIEGVYEYADKKNELNELIYELYELSYWEKQRIEDYFLPKEKIVRKKTALNKYKKTLIELLGFYLKNPITIEETSIDFNLKVVKISLNQNSDAPKANKVQKYILNEIFEQNSNENFLASQEKIFGRDCVYILKEGVNKNWTETKAFEDGQDLIKRLMINENGERIH